MRGILSEISLSYLAFAASLGFCFRFLARFSTDLQKRPDFIKLNSGCLCPVETISRFHDTVNVPLASRPLPPKDKHIISLFLAFQTTCAMDVSEVLRTLLARALNDWPSCVLGRIVKRQKLE